MHTILTYDIHMCRTDVVGPTCRMLVMQDIRKQKSYRLNLTLERCLSRREAKKIILERSGHPRYLSDRGVCKEFD